MEVVINVFIFGDDLVLKETTKVSLVQSKIKTFINTSINLENYLALNFQSKIVVPKIIN